MSRLSAGTSATGGDANGARGGSKPFQRSMNRALVLRALRERPGTPRSGLAELVGLDRSTISNIVGELIEARLVSEIDGEEDTTGAGDAGRGRVASAGGRDPAGGGPGHAGDRPRRAGRRSIGLRVVDELLCALGLEIGASGYRAIVRDNSGAVHFRENGAADFATDTAQRIAETVEAVSARAGAAGIRVVGAGCAIPGYVASGGRNAAGRARIVHSRELGLFDTQLCDRSAPGSLDTPSSPGTTSSPGITRSRSGISAGAGIPIVYDNDANCCAWGELHAGGQEGCSPRDLLFALARVGGEHLGIGFGLAIDGTVCSGAAHSAGEFYSREWRGDERSQVSLGAQVLSRFRFNADVRRAFLTEFLGNLIPVVSVLDPSVVVLGGVLREHISDIQHLFSTEFTGSYLARVADRFRTAVLGEDEIAAGAAGLFHERLFRVPRYETDAAVRWEDVASMLREVA